MGSPSEKRLQSRSIDRRTRKSCLRCLEKMSAGSSCLRAYFKIFAQVSAKENIRYKKRRFTSFRVMYMQICVLCGNIYGNAVVGKKRLLTAMRSIRQIFLWLAHTPRRRRAIFRLHVCASLFDSKTTVKVILSRVFRALLFASFS